MRPEPFLCRFPVVVLTSLLLSLPACATLARDYPPLKTVSSVDLGRYMGRWFEIASVANRFQDDCVATTADYSLQPDGEMTVVNSCRDKTFDGKLRQVTGRAWVVDPTTNAKLKVRFFWPFSGDYWILERDSHYRYALVGTPSRKYFWILSRTPTLPEEIVNRLLDHVQREGFDVEKVQYTRHPS